MPEEKRRFTELSERELRKILNENPQRIIDAEERHRASGLRKTRRLSNKATSAETLRATARLAHFAKLARQKVRKSEAAKPRSVSRYLKRK